MAKLSNREKAAKKSGGTLDYKTGKITVAPKVMAKPTVFKGAGFSGTKSMAELGGVETPEMIAYQRNLDKQYYASPQFKQDTLTNKTKGINAEADSSSIVASNRAKATKSTNSTTPPKVSDPSRFDFRKTGRADAPALPTPSMTMSQGGGGGIMDSIKGSVARGMNSLFSARGDAESTANMLSRDSGSFSTSESDRAANRRSAWDNSLGVPSVNASNQPDVPSFIADNGTQFFNGYGPEDQSLQGSLLAYQKNDPTGEDQNPSNPFGIPTAYASETDTPYNDYGGNSRYREDGQSMDNIQNPMATENGIDPTLQEEMRMQQNETYGGGKPADVSGGTTRRPYGSGAFGTGKGVQSDDPYIKELRKAYSSNGGEKWLRKQFEELIASLDPTYAQMQKEGTDALQAQLLNNNNQLASVMNANNTGDSEQRAQLMAGQQRESQTALGNLLAKLSQAKTSDISNYKSQMAGKLGEYQQTQQSNKQKLMDAIRAYRNDQYDQQYKNASLAEKGSSTKSYGTTLDKIMADKGVDATTARAIYAQQNGLRNLPFQQGDTIQELADNLDVDYATAKQMYLAEQGY